MFISIIKELMGTEIAECNEICQALIDNEYGSSNTSSHEEELSNFSGNINLYYSEIHIYQLLNKPWTSLLLT